MAACAIPPRLRRGASAPRRNVSEMRSIEAVKAPDVAKRNRYAPGGSCEAAGGKEGEREAPNPLPEAKKLAICQL